MSEKIVALPGVVHPDTRREPDPEVVKFAKVLLRLAEEGRLRTMLWVCLEADGTFGDGWAGDIRNAVHGHVGALEWIKKRYMEAVEPRTVETIRE